MDKLQFLVLIISMRSTVYITVGRPSVSPSVCTIAAPFDPYLQRRVEDID